MTEMHHALIAARAEFYERAQPTPEFLKYVGRNGLELDRIRGFAGATGILAIVDCGGGRFDFEAPGEMIQAFICEAYAEDGESVIDLVAWPPDRPKHVMTMFGRAPLLGLWEAMNPATYYGGKPLQMHRTPIEWLQSGCRGAVIVRPTLAARLLFDIDGAIAGRDRQHARELLGLLRTVVSADKVVWPEDQTRVA
jgi:hypothetical protein